MPVKSFNNTFEDLASGDNLSLTQKSNLLTQYNSNIVGIQNQLGYKPTYGTTSNPSRSAVQVINSAYDTSGNGGRKLVRLSNGWLVSAVKNGTTDTRFYKSSDNGGTWTQLCFSSGSSSGDVAIASFGTIVYFIKTSLGAAVGFAKFDATTVTNIDLSNASVDSGQTAIGNVSLVHSSTDNTLHAAWASKNATYPNSFNIRYAKGTIASDGSVSWGAVEQWTNMNSSGTDFKNPCVIISNNDAKVVFESNTGGSTYQMVIIGKTGLANAPQANYLQRYTTIYTVGGSYAQSSPSATVDGNGVIHVVWQGIDATDTTYKNIRYSKSTDGGVTWSAMLKLTTGNTDDKQLPTITCDKNNNLYVYWYHSYASYTRIRSIAYTGSWGSATDVTSNSSGGNYYPSLCDNHRDFTSPLVIWQDNVSPSVKFSGTWTDTPIIAETVTTSAVSNKELIDKVINGGKIGNGSGKKAKGTATTASDGTLTITGLTFTPSYIIIQNAGNLAVGSLYNADLSTTNYAWFNGSQTLSRVMSTNSEFVSNGTFKLSTGGGTGSFSVKWSASE